jgi:hypothetical protein
MGPRGKRKEFSPHPAPAPTPNALHTTLPLPSTEEGVKGWEEGDLGQQSYSGDVGPMEKRSEAGVGGRGL